MITRRASWPTYVALLLACVPHPAWASGLAYIRATSQYKVNESKGAYHPLNLLDDDPDTVWCEGVDGPGEGQGIQIDFKKKQRINRIALTPAAKTGRLIQSIRVSDGSKSVIINLGSSALDQTLSKPLEGSSFEITIEKVGGPNTGSALDSSVACLGDTLLYLGNALFGATKTEEKLHYDAKLDLLLGRWQGGALGAPDKELVFALDGTWEWNFKPLLGGKGRHSAGEYRFRGNRLLMREGEVGRWNDTMFKAIRVKVDTQAMGAPSGDYDSIKFNNALGDDFAGEYTNAQF